MLAIGSHDAEPLPSRHGHGVPEADRRSGHGRARAVPALTRVAAARARNRPAGRSRRRPAQRRRRPFSRLPAPPTRATRRARSSTTRRRWPSSRTSPAHAACAAGASCTPAQAQALLARTAPRARLRALDAARSGLGLAQLLPLPRARRRGGREPGASACARRRSGASCPQVLDADEMAQLVEVPGDDAEAVRDRALLELLYSSGLRVSELCDVRWRDLDAGDGTAARDRQGPQDAHRAGRRQGARRARRAARTGPLRRRGSARCAVGAARR